MDLHLPLSSLCVTCVQQQTLIIKQGRHTDTGEARGATRQCACNIVIDSAALLAPRVRTNLHHHACERACVSLAAKIGPTDFNTGRNGAYGSHWAKEFVAKNAPLHAMCGGNSENQG
ncbi:hypothetical protein GPALN_005858 [Globodera pallida]|nr:hypothetical protein GPALN_005858 [Globodera pallida]